MTLVYGDNMKELKILKDDNTGLQIAWETNPIATKYFVLGKDNNFNDHVLLETNKNNIFLNNKILENIKLISVEYIVENNDSKPVVIDRTNTYTRLKCKEYEDIKIKAFKSYNGISLSYGTLEIYDKYYIYEKERTKYKKILETEDFILSSNLIKKEKTYQIEAYKKDGEKYVLEGISKNYKPIIENNTPSKKSPKVSVVIPVYNCESLIARTIDSVISSTLKEIELIIIDDGSTDKSKEIIDWYQENYPDLIIAKHTKNQGIVKAREEGLSLATAPYTFFMDHDDYIHPNMLEKMVDCAYETDSDFVMNRPIMRSDFDSFGAYFMSNNDSENKYKCLPNDYKKYLREINNYYGDEVLFGLVLKPIESLNVVIPSLYEQYCIENNCPIKDIRKYLGNVEKKVIVFVSHFDDNKQTNKSKQRLQSMDFGLKNNYMRLQQGKIIDSHEIYARYQFNYFLLSERISY